MEQNDANVSEMTFRLKRKPLLSIFLIEASDLFIRTG